MSDITSSPTNAAMQLFNFKDNQVRAIKDVDGEVWFVAADVCRVLGYSNPAEAIRDNVRDKYIKRLNDLNIASSYIQSISGKSPLMVGEPGLYALIMKSQKGEAIEFQDWVFEQVLPAIRKTGGYVATSTGHPLLDAVEMLKRNIEAQIELERKQQEQQQQINYLEEKVEVLAAEDGYFTVAGYFALRHKNAPREEMAIVGKRATALSRTLGMPIGKRTHPVYGEVNTYHEQVLAQVLGW